VSQSGESAGSRPETSVRTVSFILAFAFILAGSLDGWVRIRQSFACALETSPHNGPP